TLSVRLTAFSTIQQIIFLGREPTKPRLSVTHPFFLVRRRWIVCRLTLLCSNMVDVGSWRAVVTDFGERAGERAALAGVLYVAGDTKIEDFALIIECAIIMPAYVSVPVKSLADHDPNKIRVPIQGDLRARRIECLGKSTRRGGVKIDSLCALWNSVRVTRWTNTVELEVAGDWVRETRILVYKVIVLNVNIVVEINLKVDIRIYRNASGVARNIACDVDSDVGVRSGCCGIHCQRTAER